MFFVCFINIIVLLKQSKNKMLLAFISRDFVSIKNMHVYLLVGFLPMNVSHWAFKRLHCPATAVDVPINVTFTAYSGKTSATFR